MSLGTLLAALAALLFGAAQFLNAAASAQLPGVAVSRWTLGSATLVTGVATALGPSGLHTGTILWALLAGAGSALGSAALYGSLETGRVSVAIPLCTTTATAIPVAVGLLALGESVDLATAVGIFSAVAAIILVTRSRRQPQATPGFPASTTPSRDDVRVRPAPTGWSTVGMPLLAGAGFAAELVGISQFPSDQVMPLLWLSFLVAVMLLLPIRTPDHGPARRRDIAAVIAAGVLTATAMIAFHQATELTGLSVAGVVVGLYPAVPVCLAIVLLGERPDRTRITGFACAAVAVLLIGGR